MGPRGRAVIRAMQTHPVELERRLAEVTEADTSRGLNFNRLFDLVREHAGADAARRCDPRGKGARFDLFAYPMREYLDAACTAAEVIGPRLGGEDAFWEALGRRSVTGFLGSAIGRAIFAVAGRDPRRLIGLAPVGYKAAASYGERSVEWLGDKRARLVMRRDFMPTAFHRGVILAALEPSEARRPTVEARATGLLDAEYLVSWE
jgi:uncharacterized protein (TIGR02265 family)